MSRDCTLCGCTEDKACLEFDADGVAHPCYWFSTDLCSACAFGEWVEPPEFDDGADTTFKKKNGKPLIVPELAGRVARSR